MRNNATIIIPTNKGCISVSIKVLPTKIEHIHAIVAVLKKEMELYVSETDLIKATFGTYYLFQRWCEYFNCNPRDN